MTGIIFVLALGAAQAVAPAPPSLPPLPIADAVARARQHAPLVLSTSALEGGASAAARLAGRWPNPLIDVRGENLGARGPLVPDPDIFTVLTEQVELGGKRGHRRAIAEADAEAATAVRREAERQVALDTVHTYMRAVRARDVGTSLTQQRASLQTLLEQLRRRVAEGYAPEADLLRLTTEDTRLLLESARTRAELTRALAELGRLMGSETAPRAEQLQLPAAVPVPAVDGAALIAAVAARPDVAVARARETRGVAAASLEQARRIPDPSVTTGYKRTQQHNTLIAGVTLSVPLFDHNGQARALAEAARRAATVDALGVRQRAEADARQTIETARQLAEAADGVRQVLLTPADGVRDAARATFREGTADILTLVDAERVYAEAQREAVAVAVDAYVAAMDARFALAQEEMP